MALVLKTACLQCCQMYTGESDGLKEQAVIARDWASGTADSNSVLEDICFYVRMCCPSNRRLVQLLPPHNALLTHSQRHHFQSSREVLIVELGSLNTEGEGRREGGEGGGEREEKEGRGEGWERV